MQRMEVTSAKASGSEGAEMIRRDRCNGHEVEEKEEIGDRNSAL